MRQRIVAVMPRPELWLLALLLWCLLSAGRSLGTPWARVALTEALRWSAGIGLALTLGFFRHTKTAARFIVTLIGALALLGIADGLQRSGGGLTGPYQDHQLYGSVLLLLLPPVVAVALTARDLRWRLGGAAAAGGGALCLALSQTRSAWAGALVAALVFGGLWLFRSRRRRHHGRTVLISAAALVGAVLGLWLLLAPLDLRAPLAARVGTLSRLDADESWQSRITIWQGASRLLAAHPLCGIGLGRYPEEQWAWTRAGHPLEPSERPSLSEEAHDFYLQTAAETGLVGLGCTALHSRRLSSRAGDGCGRQAGIALPVKMPWSSPPLVSSPGRPWTALASPSWQFAEASFLFWALLGVGLAAMRGQAPEAAAVRVPPTLRRMGQFALSGSAAVVLAANILPLGLLTPVEAYTPPTGWTYVFNSLVISGPQTVSVGTTVSYTLTATYIDKAAHPHQVDVTLDPYPGDTNKTQASTYAIIRTDGTVASSTFGAAGTSSRNNLTAAAGDSAKSVSLTGRFFDQAGIHASQPIVVAIK